MRNWNKIAIMSIKKNKALVKLHEFTPKQIVEELNKFIIGQKDAKKAVAIAIRNRYRRRLVSEEMRDEIYPKNIIMIGPTGCGKTEIARRLSKLTGAPFVKVEATKYTEIGYVGRDVESMVRDLINTSISMVKKEFRSSVESKAEKNTEERLLDLLLPSPKKKSGNSNKDESDNFAGMLSSLADMSEVGSNAHAGMQGGSASESEENFDTGETSDQSEKERKKRVRETFLTKLRSGELEDRQVEIEIQSSSSAPMVQVLSGNSMEEIDMHVQNMLSDILPRKQKKRRVSIKEARKIILEEEMERLIDPDKVHEEALDRAEQMGIIFLDEIDKICGKNSGSSSGPDVSREGVQRDLLPIVEGATVNTRHGPVKTDHILFIAAGAFHSSKPSDLIPELQGRFPIRVELEKLTKEDFRQILTGPQNSLIKQASVLMATENVELKFSEDSLDEISEIAFRVNEETENIGARRLHTILEKLLEDISFDAPEIAQKDKVITIDSNFVKEKLLSISQDRDLSQYIL